MTRPVVFLCALLLVPAAVMAQGGGWEIEVHGGGAFVNNLSGGTGSLPAPGAPFTTGTGRPSRRVSSWYFGDGAELVNDVLSLFGAPERIAPLDSVLTNRFAERDNGGGFGFRVAREITPRFGAEFNLDFTSAAVNPTSSALAGVEASSDSFVPAFFDGILSTGPFTDITAESEFLVEGDAGNQIAATGALTINLMTQGRVIPYATVGAGVIANNGDTPTADLDGNYSFSIVGFFPVAESDSVQVRHAIDDNVFIGVFGGGVKVLLTQRSGIRVDVRVHVGNYTVQTLLSADPDTVTSPSILISASIATATSPSIQFSNDEANLLNPTTLSGPTISDFETFSADGTLRQVLLTVGYFWRF